MAKTKSIITGANGFLGLWLIRRLLHEGHEVGVVVRNPASLPSDLTKQIKIFKGDITDKASLLEPFQNQEAVFHLAGLIAYKRSEHAAMHAVNVVGTQNVVDTMIQASVPKLLHLSSVVAVGASFSPEQILDENSPYTIGHLNLGYFNTKRAAEKIVVRATNENKIQSVLINPSTIYGPGDAAKGSRKTQLKVARGEFPFYTAGGVSVVDVEDVTNAIVSGFLKGKNGERYIVSGDNITVQKLFEIIADCAQVKAPDIYLPTSILKTLGYAGDLLGRIGFETSISIENAYTASMFHWFRNDKAKKEIDFKSRPAYESIEKSVRWMKDQKLI